MRLRIFTLFVCLLLATSIQAQILKGTITTAASEPIPYSSVYIRELRHGTIANEKGDYEIRLSPGKYTVVYQSLGYEPVTETLLITDNTTITKNITLSVQYYQFPEVRVSASGKDPAYAIMRKAIGMAGYYLNHISYYKAEVYLKGNLVFKKIPKLLQKSINVSSSGSSTSIRTGGKQNPEEIKIKEGDSFMMESLNEIEYTAPDKYNQKMISYNSSFLSGTGDISPMGYIEDSFY